MQNLIKNTDLLNKSVADYKINSTFETVSSTTNVEIRKSGLISTNMVLLVIITVLIIAALIYFLCKAKLFVVFQTEIVFFLTWRNKQYKTLVEPVTYLEVFSA